MRSVFDAGGYLGYVADYTKVGQEGTIVSSNLIVNLDANKSTSYPGSGSTWTNIGTGGSTYNATLSGVTYLSSPVGSFSFDGSTSYASLSRPVYNDFTLSCWFKTTATGGTASQWYQGLGLIDAEVGGITNDYGTSIGAGKVMFGTGNSDVTIVSPLTYNNGVWHHMTATRTQGTGALTLYMDGSSVATGTGSGNSLTASSTLTIGRVQAASFFSGSIAVVTVYTVALTAAQVSQNFNAQRIRFGV